jgi:predicted nucleic acid-binding protein
VSVLVDTSILIDYLRGHGGAGDILERERAAGVLRASQISRIEVLAGMRPEEEDGTRALLSTLVWHPVGPNIAEEAGALGRQWLSSHHTIDSADLAIAATAVRAHARLLTRNVRHFPMFPDLQAPY